MIELAHRIVLTEKCNRTCPHCFNADQRDAVHMDTEKLFAFWMKNMQWLKNAHLKVMGGEPTVHPEYISVMNLAIRLFNRITVFTNGTNLSLITHPDILAAHWGDKIQFIVNAFTFELNEQWKEWARYYKKIQFHFVLGEKGAIEKALLLSKCIAPVQTHFILSGDTQINIFDDKYLPEYRVRYIQSLIEIVAGLGRHGHSYSFDHCFPQCFWTQEMIDEMHDHGIRLPHLAGTQCCDQILGLLDTNFDIWYCNQTRLLIGNAFHGNTPRQIEDLKWLLQEMPGIKADDLNGKCRKCPALITCKSACWYKHAI